MTCDDCEGKMELARLTDVCGDAHTIVRTCDGSPVISIGGHAHSLYAADALWLLDSAGLNTTANELRAKLEESSRQLSEVSAIANATMNERETLKLKLAEREDDLVRAGKLWDETRRQLEEAQQTIAQLRQADTVRPGPLVEESLALPQYVRQKQIAAWDEGYDAGTNEANHSGIIEVNPYR